MEEKRKKLRNAYIDILFRMAGMHEKRGRHQAACDCYIKIIQVDQLLEAAYQRLMAVYVNCGMNSAVLRVYHDCQQVLRKKLNTKPDLKTTAIYRKIMDAPDH